MRSGLLPTPLPVWHQAAIRKTPRAARIGRAARSNPSTFMNETHGKPMKWLWCTTAVLLAGLVAPRLEAQIYSCTAKDGSRVFSDERCGPDAKVVPNISTQKAKPKPSAAPKPKVEPKPPAELDDLLKKCNDGDIASCNTWTRGGGPASLREKERKAERECETGSLADCEQRYCADGLSEDCRAKVLQAAKVAGGNWYLRDTGKAQSDGSTLYNVRCIPAEARAVRDIVVTCNAEAGPNRCGSGAGRPSYARLDLAATKLCATK